MGCHRVAVVGTLSALSVLEFSGENCSGAPAVAGAVSCSVEEEEDAAGAVAEG